MDNIFCAKFQSAFENPHYLYFPYIENDVIYLSNVELLKDFRFNRRFWNSRLNTGIEL